VAFKLRFDESVLAYLRNHEGLTREGRNRLFTNIDSDLRELGDSYMNNPDRRVSSEPLRFWYAIAMRDPPGRGGKPYHFWFIVNASAAVYGVLEVEYADEGKLPL